MARQRIAAELEDIAFDLRQRVAGLLTSGFEHDIGDHDRTGDRARFGPHERHAHLRMAVDHRFNLFGMNLQPADIDDAAAAAGKDVTVAVQFHDVAGIDKAVLVAQRHVGADIMRRSARRADMQRAVQHLHLDTAAMALDKFGRKAGKPVGDFEGDASFGRSVSVTDARLRKGMAQTVQHRLVGNLAGEPHITRQDFADRGRH